MTNYNTITVSYTHLDVYKRQVLMYDLTKYVEKQKEQQMSQENVCVWETVIQMRIIMICVKTW